MDAGCAQHRVWLEGIGGAFFGAMILCSDDNDEFMHCQLAKASDDLFSEAMPIELFLLLTVTHALFQVISIGWSDSLSRRR